MIPCRAKSALKTVAEISPTYFANVPAGYAMLATARALRGAGYAVEYSLRAQRLEKQIEAWAAEGRPYTDLFSEATLWVNGPMVHFYKHQANMPGNIRLTPLPFDVSLLPKLEFTDKDTWVKIPLPPSAAGILTHPAYLLRFQTDRARASRFFNVFLCQPFQAPEGGIPVAGVSEVFEPDLQKRTGCKYCHVLLEPAAGYWGRWTPYGAGFLDPQTFPAQRADCITCALTGNNCSADCKSFYLTKALAPPEKAWLGWLLPYNYKQPQHFKNIEQGPKLLAMTAQADNRLPRCVARSTAEWLLGRDLLAEEDDLARALASTWGRDPELGFPRLHAESSRLLAAGQQVWTVSSAPETPDSPMVAATGWGPVVGDGEG